MFHLKIMDVSFLAPLKKYISKSANDKYGLFEGDIFPITLAY